MKNADRPTLNGYDCERQGFVKAKCSICSPINEIASIEFRAIKHFSFSVHKLPKRLLKLRIKWLNGIACADTGCMQYIVV